jgi:hypothetical protein
LLLRSISCLLLAIVFKSSASSQVIVRGTVYDITKKTPIEAVTVISTSGIGTATDSFGRYTLYVKYTDSIYFSYLNKSTPKYAVADMKDPEAFDISIQKKVQQLPTVFLKQRNYRQDSIQNRLDYEKIFNYQKPGISSSSNGMTSGLDLDEFINMFSFKKNRRALSFQRRLLQQEKDNYVSHRFNKGLVRKLTGLTSPALDSFMVEYRPPYEMTVQMNDLEFGQFVVEAYKYFQQGIKVNKEYLRQFGQ